MNLCQSKITENIDYFLNQSLFPQSCLKIEIAETGLSQSSRDVLDVLHAINQLGIHLCIDDFETGHSSLNRLHSKPIQTLKVDKSFVDRISPLPRRLYYCQDDFDLGPESQYRIGS